MRLKGKNNYGNRMLDRICTAGRGFEFSPISDTKNDSEVSQGELGEATSCSRQYILSQFFLLHLQCGNFLLHCTFTLKPGITNNPIYVQKFYR